MPRVGFEPTISADERPKTYALERAATGTGYLAPLGSENISAPYFKQCFFRGGITPPD